MGRVCFLGPLPPPVGGFSYINQLMLDVLQKTHQVVVFDMKPAGALALLRHLVLFMWACGRHQPDFVYIGFSGGRRQMIDTLFAWVARMFGIRVIVHHHSFQYLNALSGLTRFCMAATLRHAIHVVLCRKMEEMLVMRYSLVKANTHVISNAAFLPASQYPVRYLMPDRLCMGFISNIVAEKGIFHFIALVKAMHARDARACALIAGGVDEAIADAFHEQIKGHDYIQWLGPVHGVKKEGFFERIDILVFPTAYRNEAEPVILWEALSRGIPAFSTSRGCIGEVCGAAAIEVYQDANSLVDAMPDYLMKLMHSPEMYVRLSEGCLQAFGAARQASLAKVAELVQGFQHAC